MNSQDGFGIEVSFNEQFDMEDLPNIDIFITSEENSYGVLFADWRDGDVLHFDFDRVKVLLDLHLILFRKYLFHIYLF